MIEEGFSTKVITPGVTTADDLIWWFRERMQTVSHIDNSALRMTIINICRRLSHP